VALDHVPAHDRRADRPAVIARPPFLFGAALLLGPGEEALVVIEA